MPAGPAQIVPVLKVLQRDLLIEHAKGPHPITRGMPIEATRQVLVNLHLVFWANATGDVVRMSPTHTALNELGRETVCIILGQYADAIVSSQDFLEKMAAPSIMADLDRELALARIMGA